MQKKKQTSSIKQIILYVLLAIIVLLLVFAEDIIKLTAKNKIALQENNPNEAIAVEANAPVVSAGMIPVKWNGENWEITTREDWYDYKNGKLAYVMLNDGYYRSEIERGVEQDQLMENNVGVGVPDDPSTRGTIFAWIPRFAYNEDGDIQYIKDVEQADENWIIPDIFTHKQVAETSPDFLLTGIWFEIDVDNAYSTRINEMNTKDSIYGFIKNTIALPSDQTTQNEIQQYIANTVGASIARPQIGDIINPNRIILHIINQKNQEPIKAKGEYNKQTGIITIQVTYTQYGINKIILENEHELTFAKENGIITTTTEGIDLEDGINTITIVDNKGNRKELKVQVISSIYVALYSDGTLAFGKSKNPIPEKGNGTLYGDISEKKYSNRIGETPPWSDNIRITTVNIVNKISPISTSNWFYGCEDLTTIENINNLNTSNVTDMSYMFCKCGSLTTLNISNFNTSNVTDMSRMFWDCNNLTSLDVSKIDTSKVTTMFYMFYGCNGLTILDTSSFKTSKVTDMGYMFSSCSNLTELDLSSFDTSNVTSMRGMFSSCSNLTELDLSSFDTSNVENMSAMFQSSSLTKLDISNFKTSKVTNMGSMFSNCKNLTELDLSSFDTSNVTNMRQIFYRCSGLNELNISNFNTSNVKDMRMMFQACTGLTELDLSNFNTENVTDMIQMFTDCKNLKTIYVGDNWKLAEETRYMFSGCGTTTTTLK